MDTESVSKLLDTLAAELERPRVLSGKVINYIRETYDIDYDAVGPFLVSRLPALEDDEVDLILSPVFTPKLADQAIFGELLGSDSLPREEWPTLIQQLVARPTRAALITADGVSQAVSLREVTLERYVHRLRLDATISRSLFQLIEQIPSPTDRSLLKAVARRAVWDNDARRNILSLYFTNARLHDAYRLDDALGLLNLMESYKLADVADLSAWIPRRLQVLQEQVSGVQAGKPFFSPQVQDMHGGERDQRRQDDARTSAQQNELAFLERLRQVLAQPGG
jgi:hypothetical protein